MKNKILILIYLLIIGGVAYFVYPVFKNRYFSPDEQGASSNSSLNENSDSLSSDSIDNNDSDSTDDISNETPVDDDIFIDISAEDCEENCEQFEDADDKKYCQQYCGSTAETNSTTDTDCEKLEDLEKDYCYKNQALTKKDFSLCKKISDKKLSEACKNQLTESILNGSNPPIE